MSDNPFDVFAADFRAAIPQEDKNDKDTAAGSEPINIMATPAAEPVPVMNSAQPVMTEQAPPMGAPAPMNGSMTGGGMYGMAPAPTGQPMYGAAPAAPMGYGMAPPPAGQPMYGGSMTGAPPPAPMNGGYGMAPAAPNAMVPSAAPANPYAGQVNPMMAGAPSGGSITGQPAPVPPSPAPPVPAPPVSEPAPVPPVSDPFGAPPAPAAPPADPWGAPAPPVAAPEPTPAPVAAPADPWGAPAPVPADPGALVPANGPPPDDPFGVFGTPTPAPEPVQPAPPVPAPTHAAAPPTNAPWGDMGFGEAPAPQQPPAPDNNFTAAGTDNLATTSVPNTDAATHNEGDLPSGGEWYDARIFTPTLGVMFFKPQELTDSLFLQTDRSLVQKLDDRPVVAFIVEGSSARAAGVELGHVLLKVNGIDVKNPKEASRLIKEGPRPLPLLFYVPDTQVVVAEGEHMVKYDTRETGAPNSAKDWKPKYCVIGGIIAQPWMMNMYRSKSEYDIAVIETQARRPVSVKVKQFSLQGARIQNDWQGPQMVKYKNKLHPWKYIVILPVSRNPIKISSPNLSQLKPVHEGIRRVLMAQQRHAPANTAQPVRADPYGNGGQGSPQRGGGYNQQYGEAPSQQPPQQQQQQQYGGGYDQQQPGGAYDTAGGVGSARRRQEY